MDNLFVTMASQIRDVLASIGLSQAMIDMSMIGVYAAAIMGIFSVAPLVLVLHERKISGYIQERPGPNRLGPQGMFQTIADLLKMMGKESILPTKVDKWPFLFAPVAMVAVSLLLFIVMPFGEGMVAANLDLGILYFLAISSLTSIVLIMAGWSSNNKYSMIGGMRAVAQMVSYELPLVFSVLGVVMITGTMRMTDIVTAQSGVWFFVYQPIGFVVFCIAALAELNRAPFDLPEGETELTGGVFTEYSPMQFALFQMAEYGNMVIMSALGVTLFFGGWLAPFGLTFIPSYIWFLFKVGTVITFIMWLRWTVPRVRVDHLMTIGWKYLLPISLINIVITGVAIYVIQNL